MSSQQAKQAKQHKEHIKQQTEFVAFLQKELELVNYAYDVSYKIGMEPETYKQLKSIMDDKIKQLHAIYFKDRETQNAV